LAVALVLSSAPVQGGKPAALRLLVSSSPDRSSPGPLSGRAVLGRIYVFVPGTEDARRVRFFLDDPGARRRARHVATKRPFDFVGRLRSKRARPFEVDALSGGRHTITASVEFRNGRTTTLQASFTVPHLAVTTAGSDSNSCTLSSPCAGLDRAYAVAAPGRIVEVAAGEYGRQVVNGTKRGKVVVRLAPDAHIADLVVHADNLEVQGGKIDDTGVEWDSSGFVSRDTDRGVFGVWGADNASFIGGDAGPSYSPGQDLEKVWISFGGVGLTKEPTNVRIDGVTFHDFRRGYDGDHPECIFIVGGNGIAIRNSKFVRCDVFSIFAGAPWFGERPPIRNVTIENNVFDASTLDGQYGGTNYSIRFASDWSQFQNFRIAYNSAKQAMALGSDAIPKSNFLFVGNLMPNTACLDGATYRYNVFAGGGKCGTTNKSVADLSALGLVNPDSVDMHPKAGSPAIDAGDRRDFPRRDILGHKRPRGRAPDAGAVEVR
jgi:hypothetical protein